MVDLVIRNARIIDGTGLPWFWGDVTVEGDKIVEVGTISDATAKRVIEADGLVLSPGFIDMHTHSDLQPLINNLHEAKIRQGVTTDVIGHDGLGLAPIIPETATILQEQVTGWNGVADFEWDWSSLTTYLDRFDNNTAINVAMHVPHGTVRMAVMGMDDRAPTDAEMTKMKTIIDQCMREGAIGLSTGLTYSPCMFATDDEMVELCTMLRPYRGFYSPHHRNYGMYALKGYSDSIEIGRKAGVPVHLTHCHFGFPVNKGRAPELLAIIDQARAEGVEVTMDTYPYLPGNTYLHAMLPSWVHSGGNAAIIERLKSPEQRAKIQHEMEVEGSDGFHNVVLGWEMVQISGVVEGDYDPAILGMYLPDAAQMAGKSNFDFFADLLIATRLSTASLLHIGNEENVQTILQHPAHVVGSDGILVGARPHPRGWGTHVKFLSHYVRDMGLLSWEEGIRKMTSATARRIGAMDRGIIRPGFKADLVLFDPDTLKDTATYENPRSYPDGIHHVAVNGKLVVEDGQTTGATPGLALREIYGRTPERFTDSLRTLL